METRRREKEQTGTDKGIRMLKALLASYIMTGGMLLLLALLLYRFSLSEKIVSISIIFIYVAASFLAGSIAGKKMETRKFLWGFLMGGLYFLVLVVVSLLVNHSLKDVATNFFTVLILCAAGGMLGGMQSNYA